MAEVHVSSSRAGWSKAHKVDLVYSPVYSCWVQVDTSEFWGPKTVSSLRVLAGVGLNVRDEPPGK